MRRFAGIFLLAFLCASIATAQTSDPQTARQALIEMFFGTSVNHLEKHLPDETRKVLKKMTDANGMSTLDEFSMFATMARSQGAKFETFDTGPTLLRTQDPRSNEVVEINVEGDNLSADEDQIQVSLHRFKNGQEESIPFFPQFPQFTFVMKSEADVWRLNEISVTIRVQLADPQFLKSIQQENNKREEQAAQFSLQTIIGAENGYQSAHGRYACSLAELGKAGANANVGRNAITLNSELISGKSTGYIFVISGCDGMQYKVAAEPQMQDSGERAFCSDESGTMRASSDGKATTCVQSGQPVQQGFGGTATGLAAVDISPGAGAGTTSTPLQAQPAQPGNGQNAGVKSSAPGVSSPPIRVSQGVMQSMIVSKVAPVYPPDARAGRVQGVVVLAAIIGQDGRIEDLRVVSGHPLLAQAALDAVKQWKYRPYLLNGKPVEVDTQVTVNFTLVTPPPQ